MPERSTVGNDLLTLIWSDVNGLEFAYRQAVQIIRAASLRVSQRSRASPFSGSHTLTLP